MKISSRRVLLTVSACLLFGATTAAATGQSPALNHNTAPAVGVSTVAPMNTPGERCDEGCDCDNDCHKPPPPKPTPPKPPKPTPPKPKPPKPSKPIGAPHTGGGGTAA